MGLRLRQTYCCIVGNQHIRRSPYVAVLSSAEACRLSWTDEQMLFAVGALIGHPVEGVRVALTDGAAHAVDSSELAFKLACQYAFRDAYSKASPTVLEPIMAVEVMVFTFLSA